MEKKIIILAMMGIITFTIPVSADIAPSPGSHQVQKCIRIWENKQKLKWEERNLYGETTHVTGKKKKEKNEIIYDTCLKKHEGYKYDIYTLLLDIPGKNIYELDTPRVENYFVDKDDPTTYHEEIYIVNQEDDNYILKKIYEIKKYKNWTETIYHDEREKWESDPFEDVKEWNPYFDAIKQLKKQGIIQGYSETSYAPEKFISRGEFLKILIWAKYKKDFIQSCKPIHTFFDEKDESFNRYKTYICIAANHGIIKGFPDWTFRADQEISFAQAAKIALLTFTTTTFKEGQPWYQEYIASLNTLLATPVTLDNKHPNTFINRWETAQLIINLNK